ncbi:helix-turn-helix domain-containing protein [Enterobacter asburiae]|uniref:winged helix-turn-helix domain-containing protein n=1 Tax=Enterobacter asburiae TaxID=61645 RepID=UPI002004270B|nr:winged helix-turn-helix domain-containing protein [Enterobacter asburiae]MCK7229999.1 helix-turn-helix domain-containing protein [Enterobacter asburiae]
MNYQLYGYLIGKEFHFDIENRCLYRLSASGSEKNLLFGALFLNSTMMNVLLYLLQNGLKRSVPKTELLKKIWEENDLSPSTQRLWQVLTSLNKKLSTLGFPDGFIHYYKGEGYRIDYSEITPLYKKEAA